MIDDRVPILISAWLGTGTVTVLPLTFFCMTIWLPRRRTSWNPFLSRTRQISAPDILRSLPKGDLDLCYVNLFVESFLDLAGRRRFEEQLNRLA